MKTRSLVQKIIYIYYTYNTVGTNFPCVSVVLCVVLLSLLFFIIIFLLLLLLLHHHIAGHIIM